jgi:hypothetical protein
MWKGGNVDYFNRQKSFSLRLKKSSYAIPLDIILRGIVFGANSYRNLG